MRVENLNISMTADKPKKLEAILYDWDRHLDIELGVEMVGNVPRRYRVVLTLEVIPEEEDAIRK